MQFAKSLLLLAALTTLVAGIAQTRALYFYLQVRASLCRHVYCTAN